MTPADTPLTAELTHEARALAILAPELPLTTPAGKPNTRAAIEHAAAALRHDPIRGRDFIRSLYAAFWRGGADLSSTTVLDRLAQEAGFPTLAVNQDDHARAAAWQRDWQDLGVGGVPCVVRSDGRVLPGLVSGAALEAFLTFVPIADAQHADR